MRYATIRAGKKLKMVITDKLKFFITGVGDEFGTHTQHVQGGPLESLESGNSTTLLSKIFFIF